MYIGLAEMAAMDADDGWSLDLSKELTDKERKEYKEHLTIQYYDSLRWKDVPLSRKKEELAKLLSTKHSLLFDAQINSIQQEIVSEDIENTEEEDKRIENGGRRC